MSTQPNENEIITKYNQTKQQYSVFFQKALELEQELNEHNLVAKTLDKLKGERRCFRKIGGVLVEKDLATVKKDLSVEINNLKATLEAVNSGMQNQEKSLTQMEEKYADIIKPTAKKDEQGKGKENNKDNKNDKGTGSILA